MSDTDEQAEHIYMATTFITCQYQYLAFFSIKIHLQLKVLLLNEKNKYFKEIEC